MFFFLLFFQRNCEADGMPFHLFRLLLLYHDPELCTFFDTRKITADLYADLWVCSNEDENENDEQRKFSLRPLDSKFIRWSFVIGRRFKSLGSIFSTRRSIFRLFSRSGFINVRKVSSTRGKFDEKLNLISVYFLTIRYEKYDFF